jgi:hypothetical protein
MGRTGTEQTRSVQHTGAVAPSHRGPPPFSFCSSSRSLHPAPGLPASGLSHPPSRSHPQPREPRPSGHVNSANHGSGGAARSRQGAQARTTGPPSTAAGRLICLPLRRHRLFTLPGFSRCHVAGRSARLASPPRPGRACEELAASRIAYRAPRGQDDDDRTVKTGPADRPRRAAVEH